MMHALLAKAEAGRAYCQRFFRLIQAFLHRRSASPCTGHAVAAD
jgi:hypothetical protein